MKPMCWTHPKFARLKMQLRTSKATAAGILEGLWHLTATFEPESGRVPFTSEELMDWLELDETLCGFTARRLIEALVDCRFVDCTNGSLVVHDWEAHRPTYLQARIRQRRHRSRQKPPPVTDVSRDSNVTVRDNNAPSASASASASDCTTSSDEEVSTTPPISPPVGDRARQPSGSSRRGATNYPPEFEEFWQAYPRKGRTEKAKALRAWKVHVEAAKADPETVIAAAREYSKCRMVQDGYVKHATTWLNGECWTDDREAWRRHHGNGNGQPIKDTTWNL